MDSRRGLAEAIEYAREGDTLAVWKLDRLARSPKHLIEIVNGFGARKVELQSQSCIKTVALPVSKSTSQNP